MLGPQPGISLQLHHVQGPRPEYSDRANVSPACGRCFQKRKRVGRHKTATYPIRHDISRVPKVMPSVRWREMFTSKLNVTAPWDRWDCVALTLAVFITIWVFALKLKTFYDLGYSGDLFVHVQLARSWLEGRGLLQDNCFGNYLTIHSYLLLLPLGLIAKPFGAPGLLFVLAASVGAAYFWATRILRLLGVDGRIAIIAAWVVLTSPLSVAFYQEPGFGFHIEILAPALCLILFYFLLQQRMLPSILTALAVISVKEDAPIAAGVVAIVASVETWISSAGKAPRFTLMTASAVRILLSVSAIPLLLAI